MRLNLFDSFKDKFVSSLEHTSRSLRLKYRSILCTPRFAAAGTRRMLRLTKPMDIASQNGMQHGKHSASVCMYP